MHTVSYQRDMTGDDIVTESPKRSVELHIPSELGYEKVAMASAASVARKMGFSPDRIENLKTALAEACINAIEHGNKQDADTAVLVVLTVEGSRLQIDVRDQGNQAIPTDVSAPRIEDRIAGQTTTRGWGMFLIKSLMDEVEFASMPEGGNEVRMVIHLEKHDT
jgi:serine/threonine-protein kinase RsbW